MGLQPHSVHQHTYPEVDSNIYDIVLFHETRKSFLAYPERLSNPSFCWRQATRPVEIGWPYALWLTSTETG